MKILVDADALPHDLRDLIYRTAERTSIPVVLVANSHQRIPLSGYVSLEVVSGGFNAADDRIVERIEKDDLVITSDIPLVDRSLTAGAVALNPRGGLYTHANIKNIMAMRDILEDLRASGEMTGGPKSFTPKNREEFANQLNRITAQYLRKRQIEELKREKIGSGSNK